VLLGKGRDLSEYVAEVMGQARMKNQLRRPADCCELGCSEEFWLGWIGKELARKLGETMIDRERRGCG